MADDVCFGREPNMVLMLSGEAWAKIHLSAERTATLIQGDDIPVAAGDVSEASRVLDLFDRYERERAVVVLPKTLVQGRM